MSPCTFSRAPGFGGSAVAALLLAVALAQPNAAWAAAGPFAGLAGSWSGEGTIVSSDGSSESLRCRATYLVENDGNDLQQELLCASDSYKLEVQSSIQYKVDAGVITGMWSEQTYDASGFVSGRATVERINAKVEGNNFTANVEVITAGDEQSVNIVPDRMEVQEVTITLRRRAN